MSGKKYLGRLMLAAASAAILTLALVAATSAALAQQLPPTGAPAAPAGPTDWTITPISSDTTWTLAGSPYLVNVALVIGDATLTIEPGVVVKFYSDKSLFVAGTLHAVGTAQAPIVFTSINDRSDGSNTGTGTPSPADWFGVTLGTATSRLEHVELRYGGGQNGGATATLLINGEMGRMPSPTLNNITVRRSNGSGIFCNYTTALLSNVTVSETIVGSSGMVAHQGNGIYMANNAIVDIRNSTLQGNAGWGVYMADSTTATTITQSTLQNNTVGGVLVKGGVVNVLGNTIRASPAGISVTGGTVTAHDNAIHSHTAYGVWNNTAACLDARGNYWGAPNGPRDGDAGTMSDSCGPAAGIAGTGDKVSRKVNAGDWLTSLPASRLGFDFIPTQAVNAAFAVRIRALDADGNVVTTYNGPVTLSDATQTLAPTAATLVNGVAALNVAIAAPAVADQITAQAGDLTGVSNPFNVAAMTWEQANPGGFGAASTDVKALAEFNGNLYAALHNLTTGGQLWRSADGLSWGNVGPGAGAGADSAIVSLAVFQSQIYTGTQNGRIYASPTGNLGDWTRITDNGFGNTYNKEPRLAVFKGRLYAAFTNSQNGVQVWRSGADGAWERVVTGGFSQINSRLATALAAYGDHLYVAVRDTTTWEAKLWRTATGDLFDPAADSPAWTRVKSWSNTTVEALAPFGGAFYAGASYTSMSGPVSQLWQSDDGATWTAAATNGFGDAANWSTPALAVYARRLFAGVTNPTTGAEVWLGNAWYQANLDGFGAAANQRIGALAAFRGRLYAGAGGTAAQIWRSLPDLEAQADASPAAASFLGEAANDLSGYALAGAGDVDGDSFADLLIAAPENDAGGSDAGRAYLVFGKAGGWTMDKRLAEADVIFRGVAADNITGAGLAGVGDVNGDGYADIAIGAPGANGTQGSVYLVSGRPRGQWPASFDLGNANASFRGEAANDQAGRFIAAAGDVNRDGYADFLVVAPDTDGGQPDAGEVYLIFGKAAGWGQNVSLGTVPASFVGEANGAGVDRAAGAGDVNGDGYADLLIAASGNSEGGANAGQTYLILGRPAGDFAANTALPGPAAASFWGEQAGDRAGRALAGGRDVNGDGLDDFLIGAANRTYLLLGGAAWALDARLSTAAATFAAGADSLALLGDANGDGYADFAVGAEGAAVYLFHGRRAADWGANFGVGHADAVYVSAAAGDLLGGALAAAGDADGDGLADLLIGARGNDEAGSSAGESYLVLGEGAGVGLAKAALRLAAPGATLTYAVRLTNYTGAAVSLTVTDALPSGVSYVEGNAQGWADGLQGGNLAWAGLLAAYETRHFTCSVALPADLTDGTRILNTVTLDDLVHGPRSLTAATVVASPVALPDLDVLPDSVFVGPPVIHQGSTHLVGARFRNNSSLEQRDVRVAFFVGEPGPTTLLGSVITIPVFAPNSVVVTRTGLVWNTSGVATGTHSIYAVVDASNRIAESNETNNRGGKLVVVRPPVADNTIPRGTISVTGNAQVTAVPGITLTLNATDAGGSGLRQMRIAEYKFDSATGSWQRANDSDWINYAATTSWTLSAGEGVKHLLAWFKDGAGNVSWPASRTHINLIVQSDAAAAALTSESIGQGEWRVYRLRLAAHRAITLTLNNVIGDPDLYLWGPDNDGWPDVYGVNVGADQITFRAPAAGIYQFAVYGAQAGSYNLGLDIGWGAQAAEIARCAPVSPAKVVLGRPPVSPGDAPAGDEVVGESVSVLYLPLIMR